MAFAQPGTILSSMDPNQRPVRRQRPTTQKTGAPSPLKKQSDYHLVALLKNATTKPMLPPATSSTGNKVLPTGAPKTPKQTSKERKKKFLCATPPTVLQDTRGKTEYDRGRQLGEGGFARCFLVQNKEGGLFAAKTVAKKSLQSQKMKAKFFGEIQVHKTMIHPNIVKFVECFEDPDNIYMILELCPNKSLMDMLRARKRFTEPEARFFLLQLLGALKYMHGKKVIHRDLKLGNIFLDENMNIKLGDFGLAALLVDENDRKKTICGTPNYIAPEVLFGGGKEGQGHSFEVDLWGVGVIMYAMLVGRPPFQANDVDSIYKKIRHNTFAWPEEVPVSSAAKSLVNSILEHDPEARPSLDDVANHRFFKSGFFPRSIPSSAAKQEPIWRGTTGQGIGALTTDREDWIKNYEDVAKICGIGSMSQGRYSPVGDHPGETVDLLTLPPSRPGPSTSEVDKIIQDRKAEDEKRKQTKQDKAYILPEALSPRDGHARMRGVGVLKKVPSLLGPSRGGLLGSGSIPARSSAIKSMDEVDEEEEEVSDEEESAPPPPPPPPPPRSFQQQPPRSFQQQPVRRSTAIAAAATATATTTTTTTTTAVRSVFPPRRGLVRSHAAEMRAVCAGTETDKPAREPPAVVLPRRETRQTAPETLPRRETRQTAPETRPDRPASSAEFRSRETKLPQDNTKESSSENGSPVIPFTPILSSKIGNSIPSTTNSAIIASLQPYIHNFNAFTASKLHTLPPQPPATVEAIRAFKKGEKNRSIFITKWVDYTNKYGVAYILTDSTCVAMFNDNTSLVVDSVGGQRVEFITQSTVDQPSGRRSQKQEVTYRRLSTSMAVMNQKKKTSKGLSSKVTMWKRFGNYMKTNLGTEAEWSFVREAEHSEQTDEDPEGGMVFVTHYARLRRCAMFRFSNGGFQLNFIDHSKLIVSSSGRTIRMITKHHRFLVMSLEEAHREVFVVRNQVVLEFGLREKLAYLSEIFTSWTSTGKFPRDYDVIEGKPLIVLGEA